MRSLIQFFINRPKLVNLLVGFVFLAGFLLLDGLRYEYNPRVDMGTVNITTVRSGSGPEEVERSITMPLEEELLKVEGIEKIFSNSMDGMSVITARLDINYHNKTLLLSDIQKAVDRAYSRLPDDLLEKPLVEEQSTQKTPVIEIHLVGDVSEEVLRSAARKVAEGLREVDGVSGENRIGYRRGEVKIMLSTEKLTRLGISIDEVQNAITSRNIRDSGGSLASFNAEKKVIAVGQFEQPKDIESVIIRAYEPGNVVRLSDVATVVQGYESWNVESRTDGRRSIVLQVHKKPTSDELHTAENIRQFVDAIRSQMPAGVELVEVNDISRLTVQMLDVLVSNAVLGLALVLFILYVTLSPRLAFWVAMGLPFSIILTFLAIDSLGISVNAINLVAIILMLGILVDDAVVVGESIQYHREKGLSGPEAAVTGTLAVAKPVMFAVLTTILAFVPMLAMGGRDGEFMKDFPVAVMIVLAASLFESQYILPAHLAHKGGKVKHNENRLLNRWSLKYQAVLSVMIHHSKKSVFAFVMVFAGIMAFGVSTINFQLYPAVDIDNVNVKVELPAGSRMSDTRDVVIALENRARELVPASDLLNITSHIGHHDTDFYGAVEGRSESWALMVVQLKPLKERTVKTHEMVELLRTELKKVSPVAELVVEPQTDIPVVDKPVQVEFISSHDNRFEAAEQLMAFLQDHPAVTESWSSYKPGRDVIDLTFNYDLLASRGLTVREVTDAVRVAMDGLIVDELQTLDERIYYRLQLPPSRESQLSTLENLSIINSQGQQIFLNSLVEFNWRAGESDIKHYQGRRTTTVYGELDTAVMSLEQLNQEVAVFITEQNWSQQYPDLRIYQGGALVQQADSLGRMNQGFLACLLAIFVALVLLFNSYSQPALVLLCLPFGVMGVVLGFGLQNIDMGYIALTGILGLMGVLVNDSLVMLHTLNNQKQDKSALLTNAEIAEGAARRFRPIVITSLTTVAGLIPTAYGIAGTNSYITPMVMAMAWGVAFGMFVTLLLLPCLYAIDRNIKLSLRNRKIEKQSTDMLGSVK